jgi:hypothetical protein
MYHADVVVNIASTLTLDAIACGTPAININFDVRENVSEHWSTKRLFLSDYIQEIIHQDASWLVESKEEFLKILKHVLYERGALQEKESGREKIVDRLMYKLDGRAGECLTSSLLALIR